MFSTDRHCNTDVRISTVQCIPCFGLEKTRQLKQELRTRYMVSIYRLSCPLLLLELTVYRLSSPEVFLRLKNCKFSLTSKLYGLIIATKYQWNPVFGNYFYLWLPWKNVSLKISIVYYSFQLPMFIKISETTCKGESLRAQI